VNQKEHPDRSKPPVAGRPRDVSFPDYFEGTLPNGLKVIVYARRDIPSVTASLVVRGGSYHDGAMPGLATMTAEMLTRGTPARDAVAIVEDVESLGGSIGAMAGWDSASAGLTILSRNFGAALEILADVVRRPTFPAEELERVREQRLAQIMQRKAHPNALAALHFNRAVYGSHPYGAPLEGDERSVSAMSTEDLSLCHRRLFVPNNMFLLAVGDTDPEWLFEKTKELLGDWTPAAAPDMDDLPVLEEEGPEVHIVDRPASVQSSIIVGHAGIERRDPEFIAASLMNTLLGGYFGSRLNLNLREDKGYTYGAHSRFDARMFRGPFSASVDVRNEVTDGAVEEILREIERIRAIPAPQEELDDVKRYVTGNFPIQIETPAQVAQRIMSIELYGLGKGYYNTYNSKVLAVTPEDVLDVARRTLRPERIRIVVAGLGSLLRETLSRFGTLKVLTPDGEALNTE